MAGAPVSRGQALLDEPAGATLAGHAHHRGRDQRQDRTNPGGQTLLLLIFVAVLIAGGSTGLGPGPGQEDTARRDALVEAVSSATLGDHLDLQVILGDDWDRMGILRPYSDNNAARQLLGYDFDIEGTSPWKNTEGGAVIVLGERFSPIAWFAVPSDQIGLHCLDAGVAAVAAEDAIYEVTEVEPGYRDLIPVPRPPWC